MVSGECASVGQAATRRWRSGGTEVDDDGMCSHGRPTRLVVSEYTEIQICQSADVRGRQMPGGGGVVGLTDII